MTYSVKFLPLKNAMLKYWCVLKDDTIVYYSLSKLDAYDKLNELEKNNGN
jgi:hypothetical protein